MTHFCWLSIFLVLAITVSHGAGQSMAMPMNNETGKMSRYSQVLQDLPCNAVLDELTVSQISNMIITVIDQQFSPGSLENTLTTTAILSRLKYGIQIIRICTSCTDFPAMLSQSSVFEEFCGSNIYGNDVQHSGLLMLPVTSEGGIPVGTLKGMLYMHPSTTASVPSNSWKGDRSSLDLQFLTAVASSPAAVILPDYMGYGQASGKDYKGYVVRKSYETSTVPLWLWTKQFLQHMTNCQAALAESAYVLGYSEGGYAAVVIADALHRMGVDIIMANAGGGPYRIGSEAILRIIQGIDDGIFPLDMRYVLALLGSAYSSTYQDIANYLRGQDMLADTERYNIVKLLQGDPTVDLLSTLIPAEDPLSIFDPNLLAFARKSIENQNFNPCLDETTARDQNAYFLCKALQENDLTYTLEHASYPVTLCQSPDDDVVSIANLPNFDRNSNLMYSRVSGKHTAAGVACITNGLLYAMVGAFHSYQPVSTNSLVGCPRTTTMPPLGSGANSNFWFFSGKEEKDFFYTKEDNSLEPPMGENITSATASSTASSNSTQGGLRGRL